MNGRLKRQRWPPKSQGSLSLADLEAEELRRGLLELEKEQQKLNPEYRSWLLHPDGSLVDWRDEDQVRAKVYAQWNENWNRHLNELAPRIGKVKAAKPESI